jgi:DNA-binding beta-propeller fold protein YncE
VTPINMTRSARPLRLLAAAAFCIAALWALAAPAGAKVVHPLQATLTGSATPAGSFTPLGVVVDPVSHDLYVSDSAHKVIDKFSAAGAYLCQITGAGESSTSASECDTSSPGLPGGALVSAFGQGAVDSTDALLFPDSNGHLVDRFSAAGAYLPPQLSAPGAGSPVQLSLDPAGNFLVADSKNHLVDKYTLATETWSTFASGTIAGAFGVGSPAGVAVDDDPSSPSFGEVYVADPKAQAVDVFSSTGTYLSQITATPAGSLSTVLGKIAVDPADGHLFVPDTGNRALDEFGPGGTFLTQTQVPSSPAAASPQGVAVDPTTGAIYVADKANNLIDAFTTEVVPDTTTEAATGIEETAAILHGHVDPDSADGGGEITECRFEYVEAAKFHPAASNPYAEGQTAPCSPAPPYAGPQDLSAAVTLSPSTAYHFRLTAANANGIPSSGEDKSFSTGALIDQESAVTSGTTINFRALIDPAGLDTTCRLQYVSDADFQAAGYQDATSLPCSPEDLGSGNGAGEARVSVTDLQIATGYHYRFLALSHGATTTGADHTVTTFGLESFGFLAEQEGGGPFDQAGGHPYELITSFQFNIFPRSPDEPGPNPEATEGISGNVKDSIAQLPAGLIGDPSAMPECTRALVLERNCPGRDQVGVIEANLEGETESPLFPVYNVRPPKGIAAEFAATPLGKVDVLIDARLRSGGDYGVTAESANITALAAVKNVNLTLWGVPADPSHDAQRRCFTRGEEGCSAEGEALRPFLRAPTSCGGPLATSLAADSWQAPGLFDRRSAAMPAITACNQLEFAPTLEARPTTNQADSPSGLDVDLHIPQEDPCSAGPPVSCRPGEADLRDATVSLPAGIAVNPAAANGLAACSASQVGLTSAPGVTPITFTPNPAACPDASKVGSVEVLSPLLSEHDEAGEPTGVHPLPGAVYIATPHENPFGSLLAIYIAVFDPQTGVVVKLAGHVVPDPVTGQLTATFEENPQLPFEDFKLHFFAGAQATLRTPATCGAYATTSVLTPWSAPESGPPATPSDHYAISQGAGGSACANSPAQEPNSPSFEAGTEAPSAGTYSPFVLHLARADGSQEIGQIDTTLPAGLIGKLAGVSECSDAALAAAAAKSGAAEQFSASCPASSRLGSVTVGAGAGPAPYYVSGSAYLAGPYKGAPLSLAIITPALAGPFDLGTVVVRAALQVDPETTRITAVSDPIPHILQGIPLDVRSIALRLDRDRFTLNPTSCARTAITGSATSVGGQAASLSDPFQVGGCKNLGFAPKLQLSLKGSTRHAGHPALKAVLTYPQQGAYANVARAQVNLPHSEFIDQANLNKTCTKPVLLARNCPATSIYGTAKAWTPLLEKPLEGPVYLVGGYGYKLPAMVAELDGQIRVLLVGKVDSGPNHGIRNTFEAVPDAPVEKFELSLKGGPKYSLLENSENLCAKPQKAIADFIAQNGRVLHLTPTIKNSCKGKSGKGKSGKGKKGKGGKKHKGKKSKGAGGHGKSGKPSANSLQLSDLLGGR